MGWAGQEAGDSYLPNSLYDSSSFIIGVALGASRSFPT